MIWIIYVLFIVGGCSGIIIEMIDNIRLASNKWACNREHTDNQFIPEQIIRPVSLRVPRVNYKPVQAAPIAERTIIKEFSIEEVSLF